MSFESIVGVNPWTALATFCNMIITFLILRHFLFKPVKKMIDDRQKDIDDLYADAGRAKEEAQALEEDYRQHLAAAKSERDEILREAVTRAAAKEREILAEANAQADAIREKAQADIAQERKKAVNELKNDLSGIAIDIAEKVTEKEISEKDHEALIEDFIRKMGDAS